jgi:phospholipid N-methyltransferase
MKNRSQFLKAFLSDKNVASLTPTSQVSIQKICKKINFKEDGTLVELGPGDGVFTKYILKQMTPASRIIVLETNKSFIDELEKIADPRLTVLHQKAEELISALKNMRIQSVDYVLSGIPFSFLKPKQRLQLLHDIAQVLKLEGKAIIYQISPLLIPYIQKIFPHRKYSLAWQNIPPLTVFEAWKHSKITV